MVMPIGGGGSGGGAPVTYLKGFIDCSTNPNYPAGLAGDLWVVSAVGAGKIGGASGIVVSAGDWILCTVNNAGGTQAAVGTSWSIQFNVQNALEYKGDIDASTNPNYPAANAGWSYVISVAGKIGGASGLDVEIWDTILCKVDGSPGGTQAAVGANWSIIQANINGAVIGPASATNNNVALFDGTTGKLIKDGGPLPSPSSPGGVDGNIQYNNGGAFGGFGFYDDATGFTGLGTTTPALTLHAKATAASPVRAEREDALNTAIVSPYQAYHTLSSGTAAAGIGAATAYFMPDALGTMLAYGRIGAVAQSVTSGAAVGDLAFYPAATGAVLVERMRIDGLNGQIWGVGLGTAALPKFSFSTDPNTGIYSSGADTLNVATGGVKRIAVDTVNTIFGSGTTSALEIPHLPSLTGASNNVAGEGAGALLTSGARNTFYGAGAGANTATVNDNTYIGYNAGTLGTAADSNTVVGAFAGDALTIGDGNCFFGINAGGANTTATGNVYIGYSAGLLATTAVGNVFVGYTAGDAVTTGGNNTFIGYNSGGATTTGGSNSFIGKDAGAANTTGLSNTFVGSGAGAANTSATNNTYIGTAAGAVSTTGASNVFVGKDAGVLNTTGLDSTFIGYNAGGAHTTGARNTFLGKSAGFTTTTGIETVMLGNNAQGATPTTSNVFIAGSDVCVLSNVYFGRGQVSATPTAYAINGTGGLGTDVAGAALNLAGGQGTGTGISGPVNIQTAPAGASGSALNALVTRATFTTDGSVGIGNTSPTGGAGSLSLGTPGSTQSLLKLSGLTSGTVTITTAAAAGTWTLTLPTDDGTPGQVWTTDGSGVVTWTTPAGTGANTGLSNLAAVAINASLIAGSAGSLDLGSGALPWRELFFSGSSGTPGTNNFKLTGVSTGGLRTLTAPDASGTLALTANKLSAFAATTSAELASVISDETGSGALVFANTPTLVTPVLGVATATSINKVAITAPATSATLTIADGATLTASANATVSGTNTGDQTSVTGNAGTATALQTARTINGVSFDGTANITVDVDKFKTFASQSGSTTANSFTDTLTINGANGNATAVSGDTLTVTGGGTTTWTGNQTQSEKLILLPETLSGDGTYSGVAEPGTAGATLAFGDIVTMDDATRKWYKADPTVALGASGDCRGRLGVCILAAAADTDPTRLLLRGKIRINAWSFTANGQALLDPSTAGTFTDVATILALPPSSGDILRAIGAMNNTNELDFQPSTDWLVYTP